MHNDNFVLLYNRIRWYLFEKIPFKSKPQFPVQMIPLVRLAAIVRLLNGTNISADEFLDAVLKPGSDSGDENQPMVQLATIHGAKGLEWDKVIFLCLDDATIPGVDSPEFYGVKLNNPSVSQAELDQIEEERRLFYVGITRAKQELHLSVPNDEGLMKWLNEGWSATPKLTPIASRFVFELGATGSRKLSSDIYSGKAKHLFKSYNGFYRKYLYDLSRV
jgi:DNA helicase-2/ATP-dependent DNA helicase PcrA